MSTARGWVLRHWSWSQHKSNNWSHSSTTISLMCYLCSGCLVQDTPWWLATPWWLLLSWLMWVQCWCLGPGPSEVFRVCQCWVTTPGTENPVLCTIINTNMVPWCLWQHFMVRLIQLLNVVFTDSCLRYARLCSLHVHGLLCSSQRDLRSHHCQESSQCCWAVPGCSWSPTRSPSSSWTPGAWAEVTARQHGQSRTLSGQSNCSEIMEN